MTSDATLNEYIQIACLPSNLSSTYPDTSMPVYAAGWGLASSGASSTPDLLNNVKLTVYTSANCRYTYFSDAAQICAGIFLNEKQTPNNLIIIIIIIIIII